MRFKLPYGNSQVSFDMPDDSDAAVILPKEVSGVRDELAAIDEALENPIHCPRLRDLAQPTDSVAIVVCDITRPAPSRLMLRGLLAELLRAGVMKERITLVVATGNHRPNTQEELDNMLGPEHAREFRVINHDCLDQKMLSFAGSTDTGLPVWVNRAVAEADVKVLTGVITPHHAAGFTGGRKSVLPGVAGLESLKVHHSFPIRPYDPVLGRLEGNTFHEEAVKAARLTGVDFILNAVVNGKREIVSVVAGDLERAYDPGTVACRSIWEVPISVPADITIVSPGGHPRDFNLHQSQKAISCAEVLTRPGGVIIVVAECRDGVGKFGGWLKSAADPWDVIERFRREGFTDEASNKAFMFARALVSHKVMMVTGGLDREELESMFLLKADSVEHAVRLALDEVGPRARVSIIPLASDMIPALQG